MMTKKFVFIIATLFACSLIAGDGQIDGAEITNESLKEMKQFESSPYFLPPFDATLGTMSHDELARLRSFMTKVINFFRDDLQSSLVKPANSGYFGSMFKSMGNVGVLLGLMGEAHGMVFAPERPFHEQFVANLNDLTESINQQANRLLIQNNYRASNVNKLPLWSRINDLIEFLRGVIQHSPVGIYVQWEWLDSSKNLASPDDPNANIDRISEIVDVLAQLKAIGYKPQLFDTIYNNLVAGQSSVSQGTKMKPLRNQISVLN